MEKAIKQATVWVQFIAAIASLVLLAKGLNSLYVIALSIAFLAWGLRIGISSDAKGGE